MELSEFLFNTHLDIGKITNSSMLNVHHQQTACWGNPQEREQYVKKEENIASLPSTESGVIHNYSTPLSFYTLVQLLDFC